MKKVSCANCEWTGTEDQCPELPAFSILERVGPGEIMPVGECPECGAVAHYDENPNLPEAVALFAIVRECIFGDGTAACTQRVIDLCLDAQKRFTITREA